MEVHGRTKIINKKPGTTKNPSLVISSLVSQHLACNRQAHVAPTGQLHGGVGQLEQMGSYSLLNNSLLFLRQIGDHMPWYYFERVIMHELAHYA